MEEPRPLSPVLQSLHDDLQLIGSFIREFSGHVVRDEISEFPIYVAFKEQAPVGRPFLNSTEHQLKWNYHASVLEEFVSTGIIPRDRVEDFMSNFPDPAEKACILVIVEGEASFVFVPLAATTP